MKIEITYPSFTHGEYPAIKLNTYPIAIETILFRQNDMVVALGFDRDPALSAYRPVVYVGKMVKGWPNFDDLIIYYTLQEVNVVNISTGNCVQFSAMENDDDGNYSTKENFEYMLKGGECGKPMCIEVTAPIKTEEEITENEAIKKQIMDKVYALLVHELQCSVDL